MLLETHVNDSLGASPPLAIYYETRELSGDPTNWWGPNVACLEALLRTAGFTYARNHLAWESRKRENGRTSYLLQAAQGSVYGDVAESATGSNSLLEEARMTIVRLSAEVEALRAKPPER